MFLFYFWVPSCQQVEANLHWSQPWTHVQSTTSITPAIGTPIPQSTLSGETIKILEQTAIILGQQKDNSTSPAKKRRLNVPEGEIRTGYPKESKTL